MSGTRREFHWHFFANDELTIQLERLEQELRTRAEHIVSSDPERPSELADVVYERDVRRAVEDFFRRPTPVVGQRYRVFLSYAREDERFAQEVYSALQDADVPTFMDARSIDPGEQWEEVIRAAMAGCRYCLCIMTPAVLSSHWCKKEIAMAHENDVTILPANRYVSVEELESAFPDLQGIQHVILRTDDDKKRIVQLLQNNRSA